MVERALGKLPGVTALVPDLLRRQDRVEHNGLSDGVVIAAARTSGLAVHLATAGAASGQAVFADMGASLIVVANSLRLLRRSS